MALRRPPTRIELKAEDIEEYEKVRAKNASDVRSTATTSAHSLLVVGSSFVRSPVRVGTLIIFCLKLLEYIGDSFFL